MTRRHDHYNVKLPPEGQDFETREQVWAAIAKKVAELNTILRRAKCDWGGKPEKGSPLDEGDADRVKRAIERLDRAADWLTMDPVEQLATLAPPERRNGVEYTPPVDALLDDYYGDFAVWLRSRPDKDSTDEIMLALHLLERSNYEEEVGDFLKVLAEKDRRRYESSLHYARGLKPEFAAREREDKRQVHECPRCETATELAYPLVGDRRRREPCRRCNGRGYVIQRGAPPEYEYSMSDLGKRTLNEGRPWTLADEAAHLRADYDPEDEDEEDRYQQRLRDLVAEGWPQ